MGHQRVGNDECPITQQLPLNKRTNVKIDMRPTQCNVYFNNKKMCTEKRADRKSSRRRLSGLPIRGTTSPLPRCTTSVSLPPAWRGLREERAARVTSTETTRSISKTFLPYWAITAKPEPTKPTETATRRSISRTF